MFGMTHLPGAGIDGGVGVCLRACSMDEAANGKIRVCSCALAV